MEYPLQERQITLAAALLLDLVDAPGRPGQHRWVDIAEGPLVGRDLAVWVLVPLAAQQNQLLLGELRVDQRKRDTVKRQIPGGEPGVFPLVGHRDDVGGVEVFPVGVAAGPAFGWR